MTVRVDELLPLLKEPQVVAELRVQLKLDEPSDLDRRLDAFMRSMTEMRDNLRRTQEDFERRQEKSSAEFRRRQEEATEEFRRNQAVLSADIRETREAVREMVDENRRRDAAYEALRSEVGTFSMSIGQWVEDAVKHDLPGYLERKRGLVIDQLERERLPRLDGGEEEVDATGLAVGLQGQVRVVAEAKNHVRVREVRAFAKKLARLESPVSVVAVLVGHFIDQTSVREGEAAGIIVVSTLGLRSGR